jgi:hypothetical protein
LFICAKDLFIAAIVAGTHRGLPRIGKSEHDGGAGRVTSPVRFSGSKQQSARRCERQALENSRRPKQQGRASVNHAHRCFFNSDLFGIEEPIAGSFFV